MATSKKEPSKPREGYEDKYDVQITLADQKDLAELVNRHLLDLVEAEQKREGEIQAVVYATQAQISALEKEKIKIKVGQNQSEIGRKRQQEVSKEDRFKGGKIPPKGLGTKK